MNDLLRILKVSGVCFFLLSVLQSFKTNTPTKTNYCYDDGYHTLQLTFIERQDTTFIYYLNVVDSGNYINGYYDLKEDYAGYFFTKNIQNNCIAFDVKNYRFPDTKYLLEITFNSDCIYWVIRDELVSYLPSEVILEKC